MWNEADRERYDRSKLRYPSDLTDGEWAFVEPHIPPAKRGGRKRDVDVREVLQAILYILETGCQWRHLPKDFPPKSTVWDYFDLWRYDGTLDRIHEALYLALREAEGREASPSAAIIDSRTAKSAECAGSVNDPVDRLPGKRGLNHRKQAMTRARGRKGSSSTSLSIRSA